jgi:hypothetical protein
MKRSAGRLAISGAAIAFLLGGCSLEIVIEDPRLDNIEDSSGGSTNESPGNSGSAESEQLLYADSVNLWFEPNFVVPEPTYEEHYANADFRYAFRKIIPLKSAPNTYFAIIGNSGFPDYYAGIQELADGSKAAIFSVWDVGSDGGCFDCEPGTARRENQIDVLAVGSDTVVEDFGFEGTGLKSMILDFDWRIEEEVAILVSLEHYGEGTSLSAAIKPGEREWQFVASFYLPISKESGMPAGFAFVEDWAGSSSLQERSALIGPTYLADQDGNGVFYSKAYVSGHNPDASGITGHSVELSEEWFEVNTGVTSEGAGVEGWFELVNPEVAPDLSLGIELIATETKATAN